MFCAFRRPHGPGRRPRAAARALAKQTRTCRGRALRLALHDGQGRAVLGAVGCCMFSRLRSGRTTSRVLRVRGGGSRRRRQRCLAVQHAGRCQGGRQSGTAGRTPRKRPDGACGPGHLLPTRGATVLKCRCGARWLSRCMVRPGPSGGHQPCDSSGGPRWCACHEGLDANSPWLANLGGEHLVTQTADTINTRSSTAAAAATATPSTHAGATGQQKLWPLRLGRGRDAGEGKRP